MDNDSSHRIIPMQMNQDVERDVDQQPNNTLGTIGSILCFPLCFPFSFFVVQEKEEAVILCCGKYSKTVTEPGCHYYGCCGRDIRKVSKTKVSCDLPNMKVIDKVGNPIIISGVLVYHFVNTKKAAIDMQNAGMFVRDQAQAVVKQIVSRYPYEHLENGGQTEPCLKTESDEIGQKFVDLLQSKVDIAGAKIISFQFNELSYAPEIAQGMLRKQQASAMVAARKVIVEGVVDIAYSAIQKLEARGITMDETEKGRIATNLLTVMCSDRDVTPTINVT